MSSQGTSSLSSCPRTSPVPRQLTTSPGPWPPGQLAPPTSHAEKLSAGPQWSSLAGLQRIPGDPSGAMNWTTHLRPHSHRLVGPAWSTRGHLQGRTLSRELSRELFTHSHRRSPGGRFSQVGADPGFSLPITPGTRVANVWPHPDHTCCPSSTAQ